MTYLLIIMLANSPMPSQIPHTLFNIISLVVDGLDYNTVYHKYSGKLEGLNL